MFDLTVINVIINISNRKELKIFDDQLRKLLT